MLIDHTTTNSFKIYNEINISRFMKEKSKNTQNSYYKHTHKISTGIDHEL